MDQGRLIHTAQMTVALIVSMRMMMKETVQTFASCQIDTALLAEISTRRVIRVQIQEEDLVDHQVVRKVVVVAATAVETQEQVRGASKEHEILQLLHREDPDKYYK